MHHHSPICKNKQNSCSSMKTELTQNLEKGEKEGMSKPHSANCYDPYNPKDLRTIYYIIALRYYWHTSGIG